MPPVVVTSRYQVVSFESLRIVAPASLELQERRCHDARATTIVFLSLHIRLTMINCLIVKSAITLYRGGRRKSRLGIFSRPSPHFTSSSILPSHKLTWALRLTHFDVSRHLSLRLVVGFGYSIGLSGAHCDEIEAGLYAYRSWLETTGTARARVSVCVCVSRMCVVCVVCLVCSTFPRRWRILSPDPVVDKGLVEHRALLRL